MDPENPLAKVAQPFATDQDPPQDSGGSAFGALNAANAAPSTARTAAEATNLGWQKYHKAPEVVSDDAYQKSKEVFDYLNPEEARPLASKPATPEKPKPSAPIIRTFKADVAEAVETKHISSVDVALAEQRRGGSKAADLSLDDTPKRNWLPVVVMVIAGIAIIGGLAFGVKLYLDNLKASSAPTTTTPTVVVPKSVILTETSREIPAEALPAGREKETLLTEIADSRITLNTMSYLYLTAQEGETKLLVSTSFFADILNLSMPSQLTRSLLPTFTLGVHAFNGNQPFLIFENSFFENAYSGMLTWEKTMERDFEGFFFAKEAAVTATSSAAILGARGVWSDEVIRNKDVRVLKNPAGKTLLMYSLPDKNTIVITTNEFTLREIFERLTTAKITR